MSQREIYVKMEEIENEIVDVSTIDRLFRLLLEKDYFDCKLSLLHIEGIDINNFDVVSASYPEHLKGEYARDLKALLIDQVNDENCQWNVRSNAKFLSCFYATMDDARKTFYYTLTTRCNERTLLAIVTLEKELVPIKYL